MATEPLTKRARITHNMQSIRVHEYGGFDALKLEEIEKPVPAADQVLVRIAAAGVNFIDTYMRSGLYKSELPIVLGKEAAGEIVAVGDGDAVKQAGLCVGQNVAFFIGSGAFAEYAVVPAAKALPVPEGMDVKTAAAVVLQGLTAHYLCTGTYAVQSGDTVLIHAGAGGTGGLLIQMCKLKGATVITTVSTDAKADEVRALGADHVIKYTDADVSVPDTVKKLTGGLGAHVAFDGVGASTWEASLKSLRVRGHLVVFGNASGKVPDIDPLVLCKYGSISLTRPSLKHYVATPEELKARSTELFDWVTSGKVRVRIGSEYPLSDVARAQEDLTSRKTTGKLLILPKSS